MFSLTSQPRAEGRSLSTGRESFCHQCLNGAVRINRPCHEPIHDLPETAIHGDRSEYLLEEPLTQEFHKYPCLLLFQKMLYLAGGKEELPVAFDLPDQFLDPQTAARLGLHHLRMPVLVGQSVHLQHNGKLADSPVSLCPVSLVDDENIADLQYPRLDGLN